MRIFFFFEKKNNNIKIKKHVSASFDQNEERAQTLLKDTCVNVLVKTRTFTFHEFICFCHIHLIWSICKMRALKQSSIMRTIFGTEFDFQYTRIEFIRFELALPYFRDQFK